MTTKVRRYIDDLQQIDLKAVLTAVRALELEGPQLRRPFCDYLRDGIFELRARHQRILYARSGNKFLLLSGFLKSTKRVPDREIEIALRARNQRD